MITDYQKIRNDIALQVATLDFIENEKNRIYDIEKCKKLFVTVTALPGITGLYTFDDENSMFEFCEKFHKTVFGSDQKENYYSDSFHNCPQDSLFISSNLGIDEYEKNEFPVLCFGTRKQLDIFNRNYNRIMLAHTLYLQEHFTLPFFNEELSYPFRDGTQGKIIIRIED